MSSIHGPGAADWSHNVGGVQLTQAEVGQVGDMFSEIEKGSSILTNPGGVSRLISSMQSILEGNTPFSQALKDVNMGSIIEGFQQYEGEGSKDFSGFGQQLADMVFNVCKALAGMGVISQAELMNTNVPGCIGFFEAAQTLSSPNNEDLFDHEMNQWLTTIQGLAA